MDKSDFSIWRDIPAPPVLENNQVHVWRIQLNALETSATAKYLSEDERLRAARFYFERDRVRFIVGRGVLRILLGQYLGREPARICFSYNAQGKPFVSGGVEFNLSHANDLMLLAVTREMPVGIDVETGRTNLNVKEIAARFFLQEEFQMLENLPEPERMEYFLRQWTRKEALVKAIGTGIAENFPGDPAPEWSIYTFCPKTEYSAALAVRGAGHDVQHLEY